MLFISPEFIFIFLPVVLTGFYITQKHNRNASLIWISIASLVFYMSSNTWFLWILLLSVFINFALSKLLEPDALLKNKIKLRKYLLILGIFTNLIILGYFKYFNFFLENVNFALNSNYSAKDIILPLGISFYTFQQIGYIVDAFRGKTKDYSFVRYFTFVSFFPQLIAGPIVNHREMMPQFDSINRFGLKYSNLSIGLTLFSIGFVKKVIIADSITGLSDHAFLTVAAGDTVSTLDAWISAISFYCQIYFDFSGYTDMAIGIARMFGVRLPINFHSPMQATSILDFWRRWHITLTRFTTAYVFMPIAVKLSSIQRNTTNNYIVNWQSRFYSFILPAFITFLLIGFWHGASWIYVAYGAFHGFLIVINYIWEDYFKRYYKLSNINALVTGLIGRLLTSIVIIFSLVLFKSPNFAATKILFLSLLGITGTNPTSDLSSTLQYGIIPLLILTIGFLIMHLAPNSQEILQKYSPAIQIYKGASYKNLNTQKFINKFIVWSFSPYQIFILGILVCFGFFLSAGSESPFLYFDF